MKPRTQKTIVFVLALVAIAMLVAARLCCGQGIADAPFASPYEAQPQCCEECRQTFAEMLGAIRLLGDRLDDIVNERTPSSDITPQIAYAKMIIMHSFAFCPACDKWKREQYLIAQQRGYNLRVVIDPQTSSKSVPWFEIWSDGQKQKTIDSYFFAETLP